MKRYSKILAIILSVFIISICCNFSYKANAAVDKPELEISVSTNKSNVNTGEEVEITYNVKPKPIDVKDINQKEDKEIVLVIDTSGSMKDNLDNGRSKLEALKVAAKEFINKFATEDKVKIGIVSYDFCGVVKQNLIYSKQGSSQLNLVIDRLAADGATNIGDGIRLAQGMLSTNASVKKYVVVMSDGMPTALSYSGTAGRDINYKERLYSYIGQNRNEVYWWYDDFVVPGKEWISNRQWINNWQWNSYYNRYYDYGHYDDIKSSWNYYENTDSDTNIKYGTYGTTDPDNYCLEYSKNMAQKFIDNKINNYMIGFSNDSDSNKLSQIASTGKGTYYDAKDAEAIKTVYSQIANQIKENYTVDNVNLKFDLPQGVEYSGSQKDVDIEGSNYKMKLPDIVYKLNKEKTQYIADEFTIKIKMKVVQAQIYNIGDNWQFSYNGFVNSYSELNKKTIVKKPGGVRIIANKMELDFDLTQKIIPDNNGKMLVNSDYEIEYTIKPHPIRRYLDERPKEIILVVDNSGSMLWAINKSENPINGQKSRIELAKAALTNFVDKFKDVPNVKIGIVNYTDEANLASFGVNKNQYMIESNKIDELHQAIEKISAGGGTNIGEGMRKGLWALSQNNNAKKYMVMMSDGEPSTYTVPRGYDKQYYEELNNENGKLLQAGEANPGSNGGYKNFYRYDMSYVNGVNYSKIMAQKGKDLGVNTFAIGFSAEAGVKNLESIATAAGGQYRAATENKESAINDVYNAIGDEIKTDIKIDNVKFSDTLPSGLQFKDGQKNSILKDLSFNFVHKGNGVYEAEPVVLKYKIRADKLGDYSLDKAKLEYKSSDEDPLTTKSFNSISVQVMDDHIVKQGLFINDPKNPQKVIPGDSYLKEGTVDIASSTYVTGGNLIRTRGEETKVNIKLNSSNNSNITVLDKVECTVYEVDGNGKLVSVTEAQKATNTNDINITLPKSTDGMHYYLIKYSFAANMKDTSNKEILTTKSFINGVDSTADFNVNIVGLPDLF